MNSISDESLMIQYANGDFAAFEVLYARNKGGLYRYLLRQLRNQNLTEDVFQDVWSSVIIGAADYQSSAKFTTWLYTIARNKVIDNTRHMKVVNIAIDQDVLIDDEVMLINDGAVAASISQQPHAIHESAEHAVAIEYCLKKLPSHQLDCFLLREEAGLSGQDIAEVVNASLEATKSRLKMAYKSLRKCLTLKLQLTTTTQSLLSQEPKS